MERLGDAAGNAGERVGVAAERHRVADRALVAGSYERANERGRVKPRTTTPANVKPLPYIAPARAAAARAVPG